MKTYNKILILFVISILLISIPTVHVKGAALGIGPSKLTLESALRGARYTKSIRVHNNGAEEINVALYATGNISGWISFYDLNRDDTENVTQNTTTPNGTVATSIIVKNETNTPIENITILSKSTKAVSVVFEIPENATNAIYDGFLFVGIIPPGEKNQSNFTAAVTLKMSVYTFIEVTGTQNLTGVVKDIWIHDTEVKYPAEIKIKFLNTGNVIAKPEIRVNITANGVYIDSFVYSKDEIEIGEIKIIELQWDTTGRVPGNYTANITVSVGDKILKTQNVSFKILPYGSLTRKGHITNLTYEGNLKIGNTIKILAMFYNSGEIGTKAKFIGEVHLDGELITIIESEELFIPKYEEDVLVSYLDIKKPGKYRIDGYVVFENKKTNTTELSFEVDTPLPVEMIVGISVAIGVAGLALLIYFLERKEIIQFDKTVKTMKNIKNTVTKIMQTTNDRNTKKIKNTVNKGKKSGASRKKRHRKINLLHKSGRD